MSTHPKPFPDASLYTMRLLDPSGTMRTNAVTNLSLSSWKLCSESQQMACPSWLTELALKTTWRMSHLDRCSKENNSRWYMEQLRENGIQTYLSIGRTSAKANQVTDLTISMVIFDVDMCPVVRHVSYIWYVWFFYESIWLWHDMHMLWYVNCMITVTVWCF